MSDELTNEQLLQLKLDAISGLIPRLAHVVAAVNEICERRATNLSDTERRALERLATTLRNHRPMTSIAEEHALAALDRLVASGGGK
jgi:hypothetical protein